MAKKQLEQFTQATDLEYTDWLHRSRSSIDNKLQVTDVVDLVQADLFYDTLAELIAETDTEKVKAGKRVVTFANQNGASVRQEWKIVDTTALPQDGGQSIALTGSGKYAEQVFGVEIMLEQFGAYGNGTDDDTSACNGLDAYLQTIPSTPKTIVISGIYKINPKNTTVAIGSSQARALGVYNSKSTVSGGGTFLIDDSIDYTLGHFAGDELYYSAIQLLCDNTTVANIHFDGNGKHTASAYNPAVVNIRFQLAACFGTAGTYRKNNHVVACTGTDFGGQALSFQYVADCTYYKCVFEKHSGMAIGPATACHALYNTNNDCYDAPIVLGSVVGGTVVGNTNTTTVNGSGLDIIGCTDIDISYNNISDASGAGIWVHYHTQQSNTSKNIRIHHNTLRENARYTGSPVVGEIVVGKTDTSSVQECEGVYIYDNDIHVDGSLGASADRVLLVGLNVDDIIFKRNKLYGTLNSSKIAIKVFDALNKLDITENEYFGSDVALIDVIAQPTNFKFSNTNIQSQYTASYFHDTGITTNEGVEARTRRNLTTSAVNAVKIAFPVTESYAVIDISLLCAGFAGETVKRIVVTGTSSTTTTVLENTTVSTFGSAAPAITIDTATTGIVYVKVAAASGTRQSQIYAKVKLTDSCVVNFNI